MSFSPKLSALPETQRNLWPRLKQIPKGFVLYGGTALALRLGHRQSEDFDFFADAPVEPERLLREVPLLADATVRQIAPNTLTVAVNCPGPVKLSFFGLHLRRVNNPEPTDDSVLMAASLLDVAGCKMAVLPERAEAKDYLDAYALLQAGVKLADALGAARAIYGGRFNPLLTLKALSYFGDGDLGTLPANVKATLRAASLLEEFSQIEPLPGGIVPP